MNALTRGLVLAGILIGSAHAQEVDPRLTRTPDPGVRVGNPAAHAMARRLFLRLSPAEIRHEAQTQYEQVHYHFKTEGARYHVSVINIIASAHSAYDSLEMTIERDDRRYYLRDVGLDGHCDAGMVTTDQHTYHFLDARRHGLGIAGAEHEASFQQLYASALHTIERELEK